MSVLERRSISRSGGQKTRFGWRRSSVSVPELRYFDRYSAKIQVVGPGNWDVFCGFSGWTVVASCNCGHIDQSSDKEPQGSIILLRLWEVHKKFSELRAKIRPRSKVFEHWSVSVARCCHGVTRWRSVFAVRSATEHTFDQRSGILAENDDMHWHGD